MSLNDLLSNQGYETWKNFRFNTIDTKTLNINNVPILPSTTYNFTINWTGPITISTNAKAIKIGNVVTISFPITSGAGNNTSSNMISQVGALPIDLRTTAKLNYPLYIESNGLTQLGSLNITSSGLMGINKSDGSPFDASIGSTGFESIGFSYVLF